MINWFTGIAGKTKRYLGNLQFTHVIPDKWHGSVTKRAGPCSTIAHGNIPPQHANGPSQMVQPQSPAPYQYQSIKPKRATICLQGQGTHLQVRAEESTWKACDNWDVSLATSTRYYLPPIIVMIATTTLSRSDHERSFCHTATCGWYVSGITCVNFPDTVYRGYRHDHWGVNK